MPGKTGLIALGLLFLGLLLAPGASASVPRVVVVEEFGATW